MAPCCSGVWFPRPAEIRAGRAFSAPPPLAFQRWVVPFASVPLDDVAVAIASSAGLIGLRGRGGQTKVYAMIDSLGDVGEALASATPASLERLYRELRLELRYLPRERAVDVQLAPRVVSARVGGGTCTLTTRLLLTI